MISMAPLVIPGGFAIGLSLLAYLLGSFPTGYLVVRMQTGLDIRTLGSGSTGATNVLRVAGKGPAVLVFSVDLAKGFLAVWLSSLLALKSGVMPNDPSWVAAIECGAGLWAILGHSKPIWLNFKGGKSVATGLGVLLGLNVPIALATLGCFGLMLALFRIVSLGSMTAALAVNLFMWGLAQPIAYRVFAFVGGAYVIWRHRANLQRLLAGTEPRIGQPLVGKQPTHP